MSESKYLVATEQWLQNAVKAQSDSEAPQNEALAGAYATIALTHATLALVEEQRTANIIAAAQLDVARGVKPWGKTLILIEERLS